MWEYPAEAVLTHFGLPCGNIAISGWAGYKMKEQDFEDFKKELLKNPDIRREYYKRVDTRHIPDNPGQGIEWL